MLKEKGKEEDQKEVVRWGCGKSSSMKVKE